MEKVEGFLFPPQGPDTSDCEEAEMGIASFLFPLLSFFFLPLRRLCLANRNIVQICRIFVFYHFKLVLFLLHHFLFFGALHWGVCGISHYDVIHCWSACNHGNVLSIALSLYQYFRLAMSL